MGTTKRVLKGAAKRLPHISFARRKPKTAALLAAGSWIANRVSPRRRRRTSLARTAVQGLGAAAVAVPLGFWVGRKVRGSGEETRDL